MVPAAEKVANLGQGGIGQLAAEIHGNLPWQGKALVALAGIEVFDADLEVGDDYLADNLQRDFLGGILRKNILEGFCHQLGRNAAAAQGRVGDDSGKRALQLPDVVVDASGYVDERFLRHVEMLEHRLLLQDSDARF